MADLVVEKREGNTIRMRGRLDIAHVTSAKEELRRLLQGRHDGWVIDLSGLDALDTAGALYLTHLAKRAQLRNLQPDHAALLELIQSLDIAEPPTEKPDASIRQMVERVGKVSDAIRHDAYEIIAFIGQSSLALARAFRHIHHLRVSSIARHIEETGINAIPLIAGIAFFISIVLAYQGVEQLRPYGGEQFTVNLITLSVLREMGVLLTALMVAGRSGSAFTAEIGVMKAREEVDALQVSGIDPFEMLVVPRIIALIIVLPLLAFIANIMGLVGGGVMMMSLLDMSPAQYMDRVQKVANLNVLFVGLVKAPVFAFFIAIIGCMHGLRVSGSAESVGHETTASVVKGMFFVLVLDALFSILFQKIGI